MRYKFLHSLMVCSLLLAPLAVAQTYLEEQRQQYREATEALSHGKRLAFKKALAKLTNYPLYPYLVYAELSTRIRWSSRHDVDAFLQDYADLPIASRLRYRWLEYLRIRHRWRDYLSYYQPGEGSVEQHCYYQLARYRNGEREGAIKEGLALWSVGKSQPRECDELFAVLIENGAISEPIAWERFRKALLNHQYQLASYLKRFLSSPDYQQLAKTWYDLDRNPKRLGSIKFDPQQAAELMPVIEHAMVHESRRNPLKAMGYWSRYRQMYNFDAATQNHIISSLVKGLYAKDQHDIADSYLRDNRYNVDTNLIEWRIRQAIAEAAWGDVRQWIELLPAEYQQEERWRYWSIRAAQLQNPQGSYHQQYTALAGQRNYYSFLASDQAGLAYSLQHVPSAPTRDMTQTIEQLPAFQRIRELLHHQEHLYARREWYAATRNFNETEWVAAAHVATAMGWPDKAIYSMIKASYWDDIDIRFPLAHHKLFSKEARENNIDLPWLFALARQESSLASDATSPAGARGLMQLMPATARQVATRYNIPYRNSRDLYRPELNVQLGSRYFRQMLDRYDSNRILATAAYNAGPYRVDRWLEKTTATLPFDAWIEQIPFKETRNYVQNVMAFATIYSHHLKIEQAMLSGTETDSLL